MDQIVTFEGQDLADLMERLRDIVDPLRPGIYRIRFGMDSEGLKVKVNEGPWSPPLGEIQKPLSVIDLAHAYDRASPRFVDPLNLMARYGKRGS